MPTLQTDSKTHTKAGAGGMPVASIAQEKNSGSAWHGGAFEDMTAMSLSQYNRRYRFVFEIAIEDLLESVVTPLLHFWPSFHSDYGPNCLSEDKVLSKFG